MFQLNQYFFFFFAKRDDVNGSIFCRKIGLAIRSFMSVTHRCYNYMTLIVNKVSSFFPSLLLLMTLFSDVDKF